MCASPEERKSPTPTQSRRRVGRDSAAAQATASAPDGAAWCGLLALLIDECQSPGPKVTPASEPSRPRLDEASYFASRRKRTRLGSRSTTARPMSTRAPRLPIGRLGWERSGSWQIAKVAETSYKSGRGPRGTRMTIMATESVSDFFCGVVQEAMRSQRVDATVGATQYVVAL